MKRRTELKMDLSPWLFTCFAMCLMLSSCAAWEEMGETAEPPVKISNQYTAVVKAATRAKLIKEPWNYFMGILSAATNEGIDLTIDE